MNTEEKKKYKTDRYCGWGDEKDKKEAEKTVHGKGECEKRVD